MPTLRLLFLGLLLLPHSLNACPFCTLQGQTLTQEVQQADLVLYGRLVDAREKEETTDLIVESTLKDHSIRAGRNRLTLPRFVYLDPRQPEQRFLIFCQVQQQKIDWYRTIPLPSNSKVPSYLQSALRLGDVPRSRRLQFFFDFLDHNEIDVANDAYREFGNAGYADLRQVAGKFPAGRVASWLRLGELFRDRFGLYGLILGHCGDASHRLLFWSMLEDPQIQRLAGSDGLLAGYTLVDPEQGWKYLRGILENPTHEFSRRYAALRAVRFFLDFRPDVVPRQQLLDALSRLLDQMDIADVVVQDLMKRQLWTLTDRLLNLASKSSPCSPTIQEALVDYAIAGLSANDPQNRAGCAELLNRLKKSIPEVVERKEAQRRREIAAALNRVRVIGHLASSTGSLDALTVALLEPEDQEVIALVPSATAAAQAMMAADITTQAPVQTTPHKDEVRSDRLPWWSASLVCLMASLLMVGWWLLSSRRRAEPSTSQGSIDHHSRVAASKTGPSTQQRL